MMNMSAMCKVGPTGGETFTVTCFACGMPSSKEWAQRVRSQPHGGHQEPFYPFLMDRSPAPPGAIVMEDGSTFLCAFCHALLESQWNNYETKVEPISPMERKYNVHKFICAVCGVETYRKRVRALPFQEFPFLIKARQPKSITLGNNPLAIVCLDCSETLWAQSAEYDRWGLPIHKRHFNWMARPPPPEDSVEATVARLPSGETQLPRCPPTDPLVPPRTNEPTALPETIPPVKPSRPKMRFESTSHSSSSSSSRTHHHHHQHQKDMTINVPNPGRKTSVGSTQGPSTLDSPGSHTQPPVVTVAPMSTQYTLTNMRKDTMSYPSSSSSSHHHHKYDNVTITETRQPPTAHGGGSSSGSLSHHQSSLFHQTPLFSPSGSYPPPGPFQWPSSLGMDSHSAGDIPRHPSPYAHFSSGGVPEGLPNPPTWPWLPPTSSPEFLRYQSYVASLQGRGLSDSYYPSAASMYPQTSVSSTASYLPHFQLQQSSSSRTSSSSPLHMTHTSSSERSSERPSHHSHSSSRSAHSFTPRGDADSSPTHHSRAGSSTPPQHYHHKQQKAGNLSDEPRSPPKASSSSKHTKSVTQEDSSTSHIEKTKKVQMSSPKRERSPEHRLHWKSKKSGIGGGGTKKAMPPKPEPISKERPVPKADVVLPKKRHWLPPTTTSESSSSSNSNVVSGPSGHKSFLERKRKYSTSALPAGNEPMDFTVRRYSIPNKSSCSLAAGSSSTSTTLKDCAIDLSLPVVTAADPHPSLGRPASCPSSSSSKFSIAYLSKSESVPEQDQEEVSSDRSSVIVTIPINDTEKQSGSDSDNKPCKTETEVDSSSIEEPESTSVVAMDRLSCEETITSDHTIMEPETNNTAKEDDVASESPQPDDNLCIGADNENDIKENPEEDNKPEDDGEITQVHLVTVGDFQLQPEDFVMKTIESFVRGDKAMKKMRKENLDKQVDFLSNLGLITPKKKCELELDTLVTRSMRNTITPLKMRIKSPTEPKLDEELEQKLLEVAFDDPSLRQTSNDPEKSLFLQNLGLKSCTKAEKSRREVEWRLVLTERIMREKRDGRLRGVKRPWDSYNKVSKLLSLPRRASRMDSSNSECLSFLTLTLPEESSGTTRRNSSDLLTTVDANASHRLTLTTTATVPLITPDVHSTSGNVKNGVCINYPKYIPSYVQTAQSKEQEKKQLNAEVKEPLKMVEILNVPLINPTGSSLPGSIANESILKIPLINASMVSTRRRSSNSTLRTTTSDDSDEELSTTEEVEKKPIFLKGSIIGSHHATSCFSSSHEIVAPQKFVPNWSDVEGILKASTAQWEKTKRVMEEALNQTDYMRSKENKKLLDEQAARLKTIRKHLKVQQADMRQTEKLFKGKEKQIMKKLRNLTKYSIPKEETWTLKYGKD